jgi:hypothetical protein
MTETWTVSDDGTTATVTGRDKISLLWKLNPIWWFGNAVEQNVDQAQWYMPTSPEWIRKIAWGIRNPLQNFRAFVIGVQDRNYTVSGKAPVLTVQRDDLQPPETGWQYCRIKLAISLPFVSYCSSHFVFYVDWQPSGFFGVKINLHI